MGEMSVGAIRFHGDIDPDVFAYSYAYASDRDSDSDMKILGAAAMWYTANHGAPM